MKNPYPPSEKVLKAISAAVNESLRLYPDPACESLRNTLAKYYGIKASEVFCGNGSDELLAFSFYGVFQSRRHYYFSGYNL